jgi:exosome complex RNA-binding protein Rrp42 (RNase PH superfamily)
MAVAPKSYVHTSYVFRKGRPLPPEPTEGTAIQSLEVLPWATSLITTENKGEPAG